MDKLTIDEAIRHCEEVAKEQNRNAAEYNEHDEWEFVNKCACEQCAADHLQLAEWLRELLELRCLKADYVIFRAEAKNLLRLAVEDIKNKNLCKEVCYRDSFACRVSDTCDFKWRYADEVEKLFKED